MKQIRKPGGRGKFARLLLLFYLVNSK